MKVVRIQHVSVNAHGRLDETRAFYRDVLELPDATRPQIPGIDGHWFTVSGAQLHLVDAPASGTGIDPAADHWCVEVEDLDAARAELDVKQIPYVEGGQGDVVQIWVTDPAGRVLELQQAR
jgi:catechol 2,3-dioxygenase-like lactoylglutathione lyase family enzyme